MKSRDLVQIFAPPLLVAVAMVVLYFAVGKQTDALAVTILTNKEGATSAHAFDVNVITALGKHLQLVGVSAVLVLLIGIPLGIIVTRPGARAIAPVINGLVSAGQAAPVLGVLILLVVLFGKIHFWIPYATLVIYAVLPVMRNTIEGIKAVEPNLLDAARGQGYSNAQVLTKVELPLAVPVILAGVRTALVLLVGTATLATFINSGGLGDIINDGIKNARDAVLIDGAVIVAGLAVLIDWLASLAERYLSPKGLRQDVGA